MTFAGNSTDFISSGTMAGLVQSEQVDAEAPKEESKEEKVIEDLPPKVVSAAPVGEDTSPNSETLSNLAADTKTIEKKKPPRKLIEEEKRAVGRIGREIWKTYFSAVAGLSTGYCSYFLSC